MDDILSTLLELPLYLDATMLLISTWAVVIWAAQAGVTQAQWASLTLRALTIIGHPLALKEIFALRAAQGASPDDPRTMELATRASRSGLWFASACGGMRRAFKWAVFVGAAFGAIILRTPEATLVTIAVLCGLAFAQEVGRPVAFGLRKNVEPLLRQLPRVLYAPVSFILDLPIFILATVGGWVVLPAVWAMYLFSASRLFHHLHRSARR